MAYKEIKKEFDDMAMSYIAKRIFTDIEDSDAYSAGIIDSMGNMKVKQSGWEFTNLDRFILAMKQTVGEDSLRQLLDVYSNHKDIDALRLIKATTKPIKSNELNILRDINSIFDSVSHNDDYIEGIGVSPYDEVLSDKISWTLTLATFILYAMKFSRIPTSIEFKANIIPSVEITFYITGCNEYKEIVDFCKQHVLIDDYGKVTPKVIRAMVSAANKMLSGGLLTYDGSKIEDQSKSWEKLGKRKVDGNW
jgi:hypothetical protein